MPIGPEWLSQRKDFFYGVPGTGSDLERYAALERRVTLANRPMSPTSKMHANNEIE